jgi:hypothetical protein
MSNTLKMYALAPREHQTALAVFADGARATGRALAPYRAKAVAVAKAVALLALMGAVGILRERMARSRIGRVTLATVRVAAAAWRSVA